MRFSTHFQESADVVAVCQFLACFALRPPPPCFLLLLRRELRWAAHMLAARLRPAPAFRRARADLVAFHVRSPASTAIIKRPVLVAVSAHGSATMGKFSNGELAPRSTLFQTA